MMLTEASPWPSIIHKAHYDGDLSKIVNRVRTEHINVKPNIGVMQGGGKTSVRNQKTPPHTWQETADLMEWFKPIIAELWNKYEYTDATLSILKSWTNIQLNKAYVEEHDHGGCHFAVSMYLDKPEGSGNIQFRNMNLPLQNNTPKVWKQAGINDYFTEVEAVTGDALIFPGWLSHRVPPNPTDKERIVLSFNVNGITSGAPTLIGTVKEDV